MLTQSDWEPFTNRMMSSRKPQRLRSTASEARHNHFFKTTSFDKPSCYIAPFLNSRQVVASPCFDFCGFPLFATISSSFRSLSTTLYQKQILSINFSSVSQPILSLYAGVLSTPQSRSSVSFFSRLRLQQKNLSRSWLRIK